MIEPLKLVKDFILNSGGISSISITRDLIKSVSNSHARYVAYLEEEKKLAEEIKERKRKSRKSKSK